MQALPAIAGTPAAVSVRPARVLARYPHDPNAFTEGLISVGGTLYESTGQYGRSELARVELATGRTLVRHRLAREYFGEGLARVGDRLYQLTWRSGTGFIYDLATLAPRATFHYCGQGWGLTRCGRWLVMSDGSARLRFIDPADFHTRASVTVTASGLPVRRLNELETVGGEIWANVCLTDRIVRIDPRSGHVVGEIDVSGIARRMPASADVANGIVYDAARNALYITGKYWPWLFRIALPAQKASARARCQSPR